ncbi:D-2-hydroxyacid dehydrogenase [Chelativorans sp. YIM 93263]|uniref:D-2-hydroxyacid dehydrogenase n=1 Tax=Chelativorans sp. YIM 93263 TaxID=2906648 RepID=UPI002378ED3E|nr:D-2-hydroxyacid dehydrogenase [Chelativorans sp. YIM 93263]
MDSTRVVALSQDMPFSQTLMDRLYAAIEPDTIIPFDPKDRGSRSAALRDAEIAIIAGDTLEDDVLEAPKLRWVHCDHAGLNRSARPEVFAKGLIVTGAAGRSAPALAEHAMMFCLVLSSGFTLFQDAQRRHEWFRGPELDQLGALYGKTMGIVGLGHTGCELAKRAKAFGMTVLGYRRRRAERPPGVDVVFCADEGQGIYELLEKSDCVVLAITLSDATHHLINAEAFARMKPSAFIINLARGEVIDRDALIAALETKQIAGAGLDVTDPEPLPVGDQLWDTPGVLITPHFSAPVADRRDRSVDIIIENLARYKAGQDLINGLTPEDIWTPDNRG